MSEEAPPQDLPAAMAALQRALAAAEANGVDPALLGGIEDSLANVRRKVRTLAKQAGGQTRPGKQTVRAQVIEALSDLGVPASAPLISAYHQAVFQSDLTAYAMASLRRDEFRRASTGNDVLIVPTLNPQLNPARALLALSTWPGWSRITSVYSERVNNLYAVRRVLDHLEALPGDDTERRTAITRLLLNFGSSLDGISFDNVDIDVARNAIVRQLALVEAKDREIRDEAAARLDHETDITRRLFGSKPGSHLRVVGGEK